MYMNAWTTADRMNSDPVGCFFGYDGSPDSLSHECQCPILFHAMRLARGSATPEEDEDVIVFLGLSPIEPTRAASLFLVNHTARAASGRLVITRIRSLAAAAVREASSPVT